MLISHLNKFIFIKTIKTAGSSVECYFEKFCMPEGEWQLSHERPEYISETGIIGYRGGDTSNSVWWNHMPATMIKNQIGDEIWNSYYKFTIVRNPFDRFISHFYFNNRSNNELFQNPETSETLVNDVKLFRQWLQKEGGSQEGRYSINGEIAVDYFIRYENLLTDIETVCDKISVPFEPSRIPRFKSNQRRFKKIPIGAYYDKKSIELVKEKSAWELDYFQYQAPDIN